MRRGTRRASTASFTVSLPGKTATSTCERLAICPPSLSHLDRRSRGRGHRRSNFRTRSVAEYLQNRHRHRAHCPSLHVNRMKVSTPRIRRATNGTPRCQKKYREDHRLAVNPAPASRQMGSEGASHAPTHTLHARGTGYTPTPSHAGTISTDLRQPAHPTKPPPEPRHTRRPHRPFASTRCPAQRDTESPGARQTGSQHESPRIGCPTAHPPKTVNLPSPATGR